MKRLFLFLLIISFVLSASAVYAQQKASLGKGNVAVKVDYINFSNMLVKSLGLDLDLDGFYVGLEGYYEIVPKLYLGAEVGYANPDTTIEILDEDVDIEVTFIPIELNLKYAIEPSPSVVIDFGAGVSYNYANFLNTQSTLFFGGQVFTDLTYKIDQFFIGINGKYQVLEYWFNDWRLGGQIGIMF